MADGAEVANVPNAVGLPQQRSSSSNNASSNTGGPDFECWCCQDTLLDPVVFPCGHDCCMGCYQSWVNSCNGYAFCPLCRARLPPTLGVCMRLKRTIEALHPAASKRRRMEQGTCAAGSDAMEARKPQAAASCAQPPGLMDSSLYYSPPAFLGYAQPTAAGFTMPVTAASYPAAAFWHQAPHQQQALWMQQHHMHQAAWQQLHSQHSNQQQHEAFAAAVGTAVASQYAQGQTAIGMPVADVVCQLQQQEDAADSEAYSNASPRSTATNAAANSVRSSGPATTASTTTSSQQPPVPAQSAAPSQRWQSVDDVPHRLACARAILTLVQSSRLSAGRSSGQTMTLVRALEVALYRSAPSRAAYLDVGTLAPRVVALLRSRAEAVPPGAAAGAALAAAVAAMEAFMPAAAAVGSI